MTATPRYHHRLREAMERRRGDWRMGGIVYQVFVDRFAPSPRAKAEDYPAPRVLRPWSESPGLGHPLPEQGVYSNEIEFWGGDLKSLQERLDHIHGLGVDLLYLNPIFEAYTNHKYDTLDYDRVDPQFGTNQDLEDLVGATHDLGMRLMLDGVFNHCGRRSPVFEAAKADSAHPDRALFEFDEGHPHGYRSWRDVENLPEWNLENPDVRRRFWDDPSGVIPRYLSEVGIDGWRLDVAHDIGFAYLEELCDRAHTARSDSVVIGECWNYPSAWLEVLDGILNMHFRLITLSLLSGRMSAHAASRAFERMFGEARVYEGLLRSHLVLDNHDVPRIATMLPDADKRELAFVLQFALPGCPVIYYGSELGMTGGEDPRNRAPMAWDAVADDNPTLGLVRRLVAIRKDNPALRFGDYLALDSDRLVAFLRVTEKARETVVCLVNPADEPVTEIVPIRDSRLADAAPMECVLTGETVMMRCGLVELTLPPRSARIFRSRDRGHVHGYSMFKRMDT